MKIQVFERDASEEDCRRVDYCCKVNGQEFLLSPSCLPGSEYAKREVEEKARELFGADVEIVYS